MKRSSVLLLFAALYSLFLLVPSGVAQGRRSDEIDFTLGVRPKHRVWDTRRPLEVDVVFRNRGRRDFYVGNKCGFGFEGYLNRRAGDGETLRYLVRWSSGSAQDCTPGREDFIRVPAGKSVRLRLSSVRVEALGAVAWEAHPRGWYAFSVRYNTSKTAPFAGVWLGSTVSDEVRLYVK